MTTASLLYTVLAETQEYGRSELPEYAQGAQRGTNVST
jgi:hypothetical protein